MSLEADASDLILSNRKKIDQIDDQIIRLLQSRVELSLKMRAVKKQSGMEIYDKLREEEVVSRLCKLNSSRLSDDNVKKIFYLIMQLSREVES